jgi:hypothetical protein
MATCARMLQMQVLAKKYPVLASTRICQNVLFRKSLMTRQTHFQFLVKKYLIFLTAEAVLVIAFTPPPPLQFRTKCF